MRIFIPQRPFWLLYYILGKRNRKISSPLEKGRKNLAVSQEGERERRGGFSPAGGENAGFWVEIFF